MFLVALRKILADAIFLDARGRLGDDDEKRGAVDWSACDGVHFFEGEGAGDAACGEFFGDPGVYVFDMFLDRRRVVDDDVGSEFREVPNWKAVRKVIN